MIKGENAVCVPYNYTAQELKKMGVTKGKMYCVLNNYVDENRNEKITIKNDEGKKKDYDAQEFRIPIGRPNKKEWKKVKKKMMKEIPDADNLLC